MAQESSSSEGNASKLVTKLKNKGPSGSVFWAKLQSFSWWPARLATVHEEEEGLGKPNAKVEQVAVVFLGLGKTKGYVNLSNIKAFTPETFNHSHSEYFKEKKFNAPGQKDFRYGLREAIRITKANDATLSYNNDILSMLDKFIEKEENVKLPTSLLCQVCHGSESSGPLIFCNECNVAPDASIPDNNEGSGYAIHFHCLPTPEKYRDVLWYCNNCCGNKGMKPGQIIDLEKI